MSLETVTLHDKPLETNDQDTEPRARERSDRFASTKVSLAKALGVSRVTVDDWQKQEGFPKPASNGRWNIDEVRGWVSALGKRGGTAAAAGGSTLAEEKILLTRAQRIHSESKTKILNRTYVPYAAAKQVGARLGAEIRSVLASLEFQSAKWVGLTNAEATTNLQELADELISKLRTLDVGLEEISRPDVKEAMSETE